MELWTVWTHALQAALALLSTQFGMTEAMAVIVMTLLARLLLLPLSLRSAYQMQIHKDTMARLKPQLDALRERCQGDRQALSQQTMALYREHGVVLLSRSTLANLLGQSGFGIGFYQALGRSQFSSPFLWLESLARPDVWLTTLVAGLMLLGMALMPGAFGDATSVWMVIVPVAIAVIAVASLPSAVGLYWAASNAVTVVQPLALRGLLARHARHPVVSAARH